MMELESYYEIIRTAEFIVSRSFCRVALQFPDHLLKDSVDVVRALKEVILSMKSEGKEKEVRFFVMADTTYGSCCVDEVGAAHIAADCVVHYGHTCLSPTSTLPAFFVYGKASIDIAHCAENIKNNALTSSKPVLVLFGLEYSHKIEEIKHALSADSATVGFESEQKLNYANVMCSFMNPSEGSKCIYDGQGKAVDSCSQNGDSSSAGTKYDLGGLVWVIGEGLKMEDHLIFWIGADNSAFANMVLTFSACDIVRYDPSEKQLANDISLQRKILKRRYYLVEKAKDANMIGILVGTLGVAGYLRMIHQMKELIARAGKKAYVLVMGKPNPAKLANFPECDVFVHVSCAQTALLDSKEFLAPIITPYEAMLAFNHGSQWTGEYVMEFRDLIGSFPAEEKTFGEARFSFLQGGYVEDCNLQESENGDIKHENALALACQIEKGLQVQDKFSNSLVKSQPKSGAEFLMTRTYHGLDLHGNNDSPEPFQIGRTGRAAGYDDEKVV